MNSSNEISENVSEVNAPTARTKRLVKTKNQTQSKRNKNKKARTDSRVRFSHSIETINSVANMGSVMSEVMTSRQTNASESGTNEQTIDAIESIESEIEVQTEDQNVTQNETQNVNLIETQSPAIDTSNLCIDLTSDESVINENGVESDPEVECISSVIRNPELCIIGETNANRRQNRNNRSDRSRSPVRDRETNDDIIEISDSSQPIKSDFKDSNSRTMSPQKGSRKSIKCPVCLDEYSMFQVSGRQLVSTNCGHLFCDRCIKEVVKTTKSCPNCRKKISTQKSYHPIYL